MNEQNKLIFVGLSGGVDSSVSALRLLKAGYSVVGVFIKTWQPDFLACNWEAERLDAMRVAAHLGIPFLTCDAEETYKHDVAEYMISEYKSGRTPNPDVMCNKFVKFGTFLKFALLNGAQGVATGHYAQVTESHGSYHLFRGKDTKKDQSYFLWTLTQDQLSKTLFPVGNSEKTSIRNEAEGALLPTFAKNDSQGVCFLGEIDMKNFLAHYITVSRGNVLATDGTVIGSHDGAFYYTIGQRHGFQVTTSKIVSTPHYVVAKDIEKNTLTVSTEPLHTDGKKILLMNVNAIQQIPPTCTAQFRYRQKPFTVEISDVTDNSCTLIVLDENIDNPSIGQSCVLYTGDECLGGGIIEKIID